MSSSQADLPLHHSSLQQDDTNPSLPAHDHHHVLSTPPLSLDEQLDPTPPNDLPDHDDDLGGRASPVYPTAPPVPPTLPELSPVDLNVADLRHSFESIFGPAPPSPAQPTRPEGARTTQTATSDVRQFAKVHKRASIVQRRQSNVMRLSEEHDKLKEELRTMTERLEAAERRRQELESSRGKYQPRGY